MDEIWKPIPGWEGLYEASSIGRVRGVDRIDSAGRQWGGRVLSPAKSTGGYRQVGLSRNGRPKYYYIHRLVLLTFHGPAPLGTECLHADGDPNNNSASNLRHGTRSENILDQVVHGRHRNASKTTCKRGHPYDEANTIVNPVRGSRSCRTCRSARTRRAAAS